MSNGWFVRDILLVKRRALCAVPSEPRSTETYANYAEGFVMSYDWDTLCDEMYWEADFNSERCLHAMEAEATKDGVNLTAKDSFDHDEYFYSAYVNTEKGLS